MAMEIVVRNGNHLIIVILIIPHARLKETGKK
jgi:hypothetical protein